MNNIKEISPGMRSVSERDTAVSIIALFDNANPGNFVMDKRSYKKHGLRNSREYDIFYCIKARCYNKKSKDYKHYGARGIGIYPGWKENFVSFYKYIIKLPNYGKEGMTLDRKDNHGNYEPGNLRWVDMSVQNINKRVSKNNKTGIKGIGLYGNKYRVRIYRNGKDVHIGMFNTIEEALNARHKYMEENTKI